MDPFNLPSSWLPTPEQLLALQNKEERRAFVPTNLLVRLLGPSAVIDKKPATPAPAAAAAAAAAVAPADGAAARQLLATSGSAGGAADGGSSGGSCEAAGEGTLAAAGGEVVVPGVPGLELGALASRAAAQKAKAAIHLQTQGPPKLTKEQRDQLQVCRLSGGRGGGGLEGEGNAPSFPRALCSAGLAASAPPLRSEEAPKPAASPPPACTCPAEGEGGCEAA
jgi:hypothetical protein